VTLTERDPDRAERARADGFAVVVGDGSREETLLEAGVEDADAIGALTGDLNANFVACLIGNHHGCRTVMRIDEDYREEIYERYAEEVDEVIYPERLGAILAKNALLGGSMRAVADVAGNLQAVVFTVAASSPMAGYSISELALPANARLLAFGKADASMGIPLPDDSLEAGDRVAILADAEVLADVRHLFVGDAGAVAEAGGEAA
jgi:trk system potassium uptake protein TrkA